MQERHGVSNEVIKDMIIRFKEYQQIIKDKSVDQIETIFNDLDIPELASLRVSFSCLQKYIDLKKEELDNFKKDNKLNSESSIIHPKEKELINFETELKCFESLINPIIQKRIEKEFPKKIKPPRKKVTEYREDFLN